MHTTVIKISCKHKKTLGQVGSVKLRLNPTPTGSPSPVNTLSYLTATDEIGPLTQQVNDLALALVAPLSAQHNAGLCLGAPAGPRPIGTRAGRGAGGVR